MTEYSPAWPHGPIKQVFEDLFVVCGTNITFFQNSKIQHSRNMTVVRFGHELTLINTVRLDDAGLKALDSLGAVKHILSIGAFHGRDDAFYQDRYRAKLWTVLDKHSEDDNPDTVRLTTGMTLPIANSQFILFNNASPREGFIYMSSHGGVVITCDSLKNWLEVDEFFSLETGREAISNGEIAKARISPIWLQATGVQKTDFDPMSALHFETLISAHGDVLTNNAKTAVECSINTL